MSKIAKVITILSLLTLTVLAQKVQIGIPLTNYLSNDALKGTDWIALSTNCFAVAWNITPSTDKYGMDFNPTNVIFVFYYEPIVVKTNGAWQVTFKP